MKPIPNRPVFVFNAVFCFLFPIFLLSIAQPSYAQWAATYGGTTADGAISIQQTSDGGYITAGETESFGAGILDLWVLKLDSSGNVQWQKTYGVSFTIQEVLSIQQTSDGGYIVAGWTFVSFATGDMDLWVLKLDSSGNVQWQKTYGGGGIEVASSIQQTGDGGYIVAGFTFSFGAGRNDLWVLKLDSSGNVEWQKTYGGSDGEEAYSIQQTSDGGYIVAGWTLSFGAGDLDFWVLKLDSSGNVQWQKAYGGSFADDAGSIQQTSDGGYIVTGDTDSFGAGVVDLWVLKLDSNGNVQWQKTFGGSDKDEATSIRQTSDGGYIVAGLTFSFGAGDSDFWVLKLDSSGNAQWQRTYGGSFADEANSIQQASDGDYIVAGETASFGAGDSDFWVLKLKPDGSIDPSCNFIGETSVSGIDSSATVTNTNASIVDTIVTPQITSATVQDTNVSANILCLVQCDSTDYSRRRSFIRFRGGRKDKASMRMCVNQTFCNALKAAPEEIVLELDGCDPVTIPGSMLKSNRTMTRFRAKSSTFVLKIDCIRGWLKLRLRNVDLKGCVFNPVEACVSITNGPCLCAEEEFTEKQNKRGRLKKLSLRVFGACLHR